MTPSTRFHRLIQLFACCSHRQFGSGNTTEDVEIIDLEAEFVDAAIKQSIADNQVIVDDSDCDCRPVHERYYF